MVQEASEKDIPEIVELLKLSLGESLMPKSESYWRWKHIDNPFGISPVLLYREDSLLVGVRAFMRWKWMKDGMIYNAVRAVDTATHPAQQGKGIFKKLTLELVSNCKEHGISFIFNTPNSQSMPGYLKMGWEEAGKLPVNLVVNKPINLLKNILFGTTTSGSLHEDDLKSTLNHPDIDELLVLQSNKRGGLSTYISREYLIWRYVSVPVVKYVHAVEIVGGKLTGLAIGRVKKSKFGTELRITDCFLSDDTDGTQLAKNIRALRKIHKIDFTTMSGTSISNFRKLSPLGVSLKIGPIVTIRPLAMSDLDILDDFKGWSPSLGDLELF